MKRKLFITFLLVVNFLALLTVAQRVLAADNLLCNDKQVTNNFYCTPTPVTKAVAKVLQNKPVLKAPRKSITISRKITVTPAAVYDAESWCMTRGGLKYIEIDTLSNEIRGAWRYVCNN